MKGIIVALGGSFTLQSRPVSEIDANIALVDRSRVNLWERWEKYRSEFFEFNL